MWVPNLKAPAPVPLSSTSLRVRIERNPNTRGGSVNSVRNSVNRGLARETRENSVRTLRDYQRGVSCRAARKRINSSGFLESQQKTASLRSAALRYNPKNPGFVMQEKS